MWSVWSGATARSVPCPGQPGAWSWCGWGSGAGSSTVRRSVDKCSLAPQTQRPGGRRSGMHATSTTTRERTRKHTPIGKEAANLYDRSIPFCRAVAKGQLNSYRGSRSERSPAGIEHLRIFHRQQPETDERVPLVDFGRHLVSVRTAIEKSRSRMTPRHSLASILNHYERDTSREPTAKRSRKRQRARTGGPTPSVSGSVTGHTLRIAQI